MGNAENSSWVFYASIVDGGDWVNSFFSDYEEHEFKLFYSFIHV